MNSILRYTLIEYCTQSTDRGTAIEMVDFAQLHCPFSDTHKVKQYLDELMRCENCGHLDHEDNMVDTFGAINGSVGIVCLDCARDGG